MATLATSVLACAVIAPLSAADGATTAAAAMPQTTPGPVPGAVQRVPASGTPELAPNGHTEQIRQIVQCGSMMYAVGSFTEISWNGQTYSRNNAFSFSATAPYTISTWNPNVNGQVNTIAFNGTSCYRAYLGGAFTNVGGHWAEDIAEVRGVLTGAFVSTFRHHASGNVDTIVANSNRLIVGGVFKWINGTSRPYLASLSTTNGRVTAYLNLHVSGTYSNGSDVTHIYNQQLSPTGNLDLVEGVFTKIGGQSRQQIAMLNLQSTGPTVTGWRSWQFTKPCSSKHPFYIRAAAWSPDMSTIYLAATGYRPPGSTGPGGLCDAVSAYSATRGRHTYEWINYTGCDSLFSVAADTYAVYVGGHERWADNPNGCDAAGPGSLSAAGMGGFTLNGPSNDNLITNGTVNGGVTEGYYSKTRGLGADDMLLVPNEGLWIASDNLANSDRCSGQSGHAGICFLPYAS